MTAASPDSPDAPAARRAGRSRQTPDAGRRRLRRRVRTGVRLTLALALVGGVYAAFAPNNRATATPSQNDMAAAGESLYKNTCINCHGTNAQGVPGQGPSLIGVGSAAVYFQVTTGRMPATRSTVQPPRKKPTLTEEQANQLGAYIQQLGGGPTTPMEDLKGGNVAAGGELFRLNCSSCHAFGGAGGALSKGSNAPGLKLATDRQIYTAMLSGPQQMPVFGDSQLSPQEKRDIIAYVDSLKKSDTDIGGFSLGRLGPATEALVIFMVGIVALLFTTLWIAGKS